MVDKYLVLGNPIAHSKSPFIHQRFAKQTSEDISYDKCLVDIDAFESFILDFKEQGGKGCNITVPFKERAYALSQQLSPRAKAAGAVNTLIFSDNGVIIGDNTDGQGLVEDLLLNNVQLSQQRILIIGAGGAARGSILPLLAQRPTSITITNRTIEKAQRLVSEFQDDKLHYTALENISGHFDVIINSTSASLSNQLPAISSDVIANASCCYDMAYGNEPTCFIQWAKDLGVATTIDGLGMLVGQAAESFRLWRNVKPDTKDILSEMRSQL
jgi:shikimate dehydrogenase